jgi:hypothetical protein
MKIKIGKNGHTLLEMSVEELITRYLFRCQTAIIRPYEIEVTLSDGSHETATVLEEPDEPANHPFDIEG